MGARDYYAVLGISQEADGATIKRSFRTRARLLHPDVSEDPDAEGKFRELADAYSVLSRPASRLLYDRFGYRGSGAWASPAGAQAVSGLLEFWARSRRRSRHAGAAAVVELEFFEAARGGRRRVSYVSSGPCDACGGSGAGGGGHAEACTACAGRGRIRETTESGGVRVLELITCAECGGSGRLVSDPCRECDGAGEREAEREAEVPIPSGVEDGARLPLDGENEEGPYVVIRVRPQPPDSVLLRTAAAAGLLVAVGFLVFLLAG